MKNWSLLIGSSIFFIILLTGFLAPHLPFVDNQLTENVLMRDEQGKPLVPAYAPSKDYPWGSDYKGVDVLSILLLGTKETLTIIFSIAILRYIMAIPLAIGAFYIPIIRSILKGWNQLFSYFPPILFVVMIVGIPFIFYSNVHAVWMVLILATIEVGRVADIFLSKMENTSQKPFLESGIVGGCSRFTLFKNYFWPDLQPHILTNFFNDLARVLFLIAQLGVIGVFLSHDFFSQRGGTFEAINSSNSWPALLVDIHQDMWGHEWIPVSSIMMITITLFSIHLISDGLEKYFQRKYNKSQGVGI
ncbi:ABC transporter permease subunit [Heyndrickxia oleronia]|uniref:ABC transporter permease subunit n=1 Tax=Heyndrickxia oleronia TaxID=38875 RepID=UPI00203F9719|nr:ABC transporter permease subunit [Heyndrickxia oleronia]MCM3237565.1 ABC transporter permease subunit [Heyndrickxia oleronia]